EIKVLFLDRKSIILSICILLGVSCNNPPPVSDIHLSNIAHITLKDCASKEYTIHSKDRIQEFWRILSESKEVQLEDLKLNTGFASVSIDLNSEESVHFEIVAHQV